jgi:DNA-binding CsgD family transcriptional regulator
MPTELEPLVLTLVGEVMGLLDLEELCHGMLVALRQAVPADWCALNEVPADLPRTVSLTDPPVSPEVHETFARLAHQNPLAAHFLASPEGRALRFSDLITRSELHALELYQEMYRSLGVEYQIAFTLPSPSERILGVSLSRSHCDFTDTERDLLNLARPYLIQAYRNALLVTVPEAFAARSPDAGALRSLGLTPRQAEVLRLVAMGSSDYDVGAILGISARTVEKHLEHCYRVLGVANRSQAARRAWAVADTTMGL